MLISNQREVAENNVCQRESETRLEVESFLLASPAQTRKCVNFREHYEHSNILLARRQSLEVDKFHGKHFHLAS